MSEVKLVKAQLIEMKEDLKTELSTGEGGKKINVQFNPDSLKVTFANQLAQPSGGDQSSGTAGKQFVGAGSTKLALTLWFDVTQMTEKKVDDVRRLTKDVIHFITPKDSKNDPKKKMPPAARFVWGSFIFDGMVEGLEESLEYFSPDGKPLRASVALTLSQQKILVSEFKGTGSVAGGKEPKKFEPAKQGDTIQGMFENARGGAPASGNSAGPGGTSSKGAGAGGNDWQSVAAGNNIEDPLRLPAGSLIDMNVKASVGGGFGVGASATAQPLTGPSLPAPTITIQPPRAQLGLA